MTARFAAIQHKAATEACTMPHLRALYNADGIANYTSLHIWTYCSLIAIGQCKAGIM